MRRLTFEPRCIFVYLFEIWAQKLSLSIYQKKYVWCLGFASCLVLLVILVIFDFNCMYVHFIV